MTYKLTFKVAAEKEWRKLDSSLKEYFKKKLKERLENPHVPSARLKGLENFYKIKLRRSGYRLVYQVFDERVVVTVIAVGRRERSKVYENAAKRLGQ